MSVKAFKRIPLIEANRICPICKNKVKQIKEFGVELHGVEPVLFVCEMLYCSHCNIPYADSDTVRKAFSQSGGLWMQTFSVNGKKSQSYVRELMSDNRKQLNNAWTYSEDLEIMDGYQSVSSKLKKIIGTKKELEKCHRCSSELSQGFTLIPINEVQKVKVKGKVCTNCKCLYTAHINAIERLMMDNPLCEGFTLNGDEIWDTKIVKEKRIREKKAIERAEAEKRKKLEEAVLEKRLARLSSIESSVVMICAKFANEINEFVIVKDKLYSKSDELIFHYTSIEARELLSAAFEESRNKRGRYINEEFTVECYVCPDKKTTVSEFVFPESIHIRTGGGYSSSLYNKNFEIIDLLAYSPMNNIYEVVRATYNRKYDMCYTDISLYRRFVSKYGNPKLHLEFDESASYSVKFNFGDLQAESILKGYGYSVSKEAAQSKEYRRELLSEIIDLEILSVKQVVSFLMFLIRIHTKATYAPARNKWSEDVLFIENYKVNPSRFMIARHG